MIDYLDDIYEFQKLFMEVVAEIRSHNMMTFPVLSISLLRQDGKFVDEEFARWGIEHNRIWSDSNLFVDDSVTSLSNCCFDGSQMTLTKSSAGVNYMTFKELYDSPYDDTKHNFTVFHNGYWKKGKVVRLPKRDMFVVRTANKKEIIVTDNHINVTLNGDKTTTQLTTDDYLMFNTMPMSAVDNKHELSYEQGFLIGMYAGDGSMYKEDGNTTTSVCLSLNQEKYEAAIEILNKACQQITKAECKVRLGKQ